MLPEDLPFRMDSNARSIASREDYISECEMVEEEHHTTCIQMVAFDESEFID